MVTGTPPVLPPGYMSLYQAIDCVDPGVLQQGDDQARKDADRFLHSLEWRALPKHGAAVIASELGQPGYDEICRRVRRRSAFARVRDLCAWGTVPSALLPDDFSRPLRIPPANWLDERLSADLSSTGRTTIGDRPTRVSGWVMIETAAFRVATDITSVPPSVSAPRPGAEDAGLPQEPHDAAGTRAKAPTRPIRISASPEKIKAAVYQWVKEPRARPMKRDDFVREFQDLTNFERPAAREAYSMLPSKLKHRVGRPENRL